MDFHEEFLVAIPMFDASSLPLFPPAMASILSRRRCALLEAVVEAGNRRKRRCSPFTWRPSNAVNSWDIAPQKERARILVRFYCSILLIFFGELGLREHVRQKPWFSPWRNLKVVHMFPWSNSGNKNRGDAQTGNAIMAMGNPNGECSIARTQQYGQPSTDQQELDTVTSPSCSILANLIILGCLGYSMVSRIPQSRILAAEVDNPTTDVQWFRQEAIQPKHRGKRGLNLGPEVTERLHQWILFCVLK